MLSRVAERLYWFARYIERAENTARLLLVHHQLTLDLPADIHPEWTFIVDILGAREDFDKTKLAPTERNVVSFVFGDRDVSSSIFNSIISARDNIRTTREVMPSEAWEYVNSLFLSVSQRANKSLPKSQRHKVLNGIIGACQKCVGLLTSTMNHDEAYQFIRLGRNIERADMSTRIIDASTTTLVGDSDEIQPYRNVLWLSILHSLSAYQMYRMSVRRNIVAVEALNFLLKSAVFPRSTAHNLTVLEACVQALPSHEAALTAIQKTHKKLQKVDFNELSHDGLHQFIDELQTYIFGIHSQITETWFNHNR